MWEFVSRWRKYAFQYEEEFRERAREAESATEPSAEAHLQTPARLQGESGLGTLVFAADVKNK